jgi:hypothetical protein
MKDEGLEVCSLKECVRKKTQYLGVVEELYTPYREDEVRREL